MLYDDIIMVMDNNGPKQVFARDIMTKKFISAYPETRLLDAAKIISEHNFDGLPVIDQNGLLVGILTEYDLMTITSGVNSSFLEKILSDIHGKNSSGPESKNITEMRVSDIMNTEPLALQENTTFEKLIQAFIAHHRVNPIPIIDTKNKVVGIISRADVLRPLNLLGYGVSNKK